MELRLFFSDKEVKQLLQKKFEKSYAVAGVNSDFCFNIEQRYVFIEYENSSRGLCSHAAKYARLLEQNRLDKRFAVVFIRSLKHQRSWDSDLLNALCVLDKFYIDYCVVDCTGSKESLISNIEQILNYAKSDGRLVDYEHNSHLDMWYEEYKRLNGGHDFETYKKNLNVFFYLTQTSYILGLGKTKEQAYCNWIRHIRNRDEAKRYFYSVDRVTSYS